MSFPTIEFAIFFLVVATVSWMLRSRRTIQKIFLLVASYWFYARWDLRLLALLAFVSVFAWGMARGLERAQSPGARRALVTAAVLGNVALLGVFKLYDFFRATVADFAGFLGMSAHLPIVEILLPIGISFYVFQAIAYVVDVYRRDAFTSHSLLDFLLFMAFFPQLLAGPICRSRDLLPQIAGEGPRKVLEPSRAVALIASGLFKKMVLASFLATHLVDDAFMMPAGYSSLELLLAVFAYTAQIYLDFSGYTDLARGLALLLGFELPENFKNPYAATNLGDYWRRWHITFSTWLRDYVYFPLGGSRVSRPRAYLNLVITFAVCGLWHGAQWRFVVWGVAHGIGLAVYRASLDLRRDRGIDPRKAALSSGPSSPAWAVAGWAATLSFCALTRIPFKAPDLAMAGELFHGLAQLSVRGKGIDPLVVVATVIAIGMNFVGRPIFDTFIRWHARIPSAMRPVAWVTLGLALFAITSRDVAPYIYFGF